MMLLGKHGDGAGTAAAAVWCCSWSHLLLWGVKIHQSRGEKVTGRAQVQERGLVQELEPELVISLKDGVRR